MAAQTRERMVDGAVRLLATRGLQGTSFAEVVALTGAPRGSIYHHFPEGKDELVAAAVERAGANASGALAGLAGRSAEEVVDGFLALWRRLLVATDFGAGCSVAAVTVAGDAALRSSAGQVFHAWRTELAGLLVAGGVDDAPARGFAALLVSAAEGAVILARAEASLDAFDAVAAELRARAAALSSAGTS